MASSLRERRNPCHAIFKRPVGQLSNTRTHGRGLYPAPPPLPGRSTSCEARSRKISPHDSSSPQARSFWNLAQAEGRSREHSLIVGFRWSPSRRMRSYTASCDRACSVEQTSSATTATSSSGRCRAGRTPSASNVPFSITAALVRRLLDVAAPARGGAADRPTRGRRAMGRRVRDARGPCVQAVV